MTQALNRLPWWLLVLGCLTIGLAPYQPPHVIEKLRMLVTGELTRPVDVGDLFLHGTPWVLLLLKLIQKWRRT